MRVSRVVFAVLLGLALARSGAVGQSRQDQPTMQMPDGTPMRSDPRIDRDPFREKNERDREKARNLERQRRMVVEAERLLLLASELKTSAAKAGTLSEEDGKKLDEIGKLARSVKTRMRD